ncbi:hypothetical protein ACLIBH_05610 [Virgibacillus sp. W0430]|uniref:hypothetical protein n=1 Tax=Virgibacillus sp. W0430 TaxID=3391580 RepID=UPI003F47F1B9
MENTNEKYSVAFGWGSSGTLTLQTDKGEGTESFPHMEKIPPNAHEVYTFKFKQIDGTPESLVVNNVLLVDGLDGSLPTPGSEETFTIPLTD